MRAASPAATTINIPSPMLNVRSISAGAMPVDAISSKIAGTSHVARSSSTATVSSAKIRGRSPPTPPHVMSAAPVPPMPAPRFTPGVALTVAPPAARRSSAPGPRAGVGWVPGFGDRRGNHQVWSKGNWERERRGYYWHPNRWEQRDGRWVLEKGRWDRERFVENRAYGDRDHDGVPNRVDRDRDGDGVPNRYDRAPDNPRRR